MKNNCKAPRLS